MLSRIVLLALFALTSNGVYADEHEEAETKPAADSAVEEKVCFDRSQVNSFDGLSERHVYIKEGVNDYFLLTTRHRCRGLDDARSIAIENTTRKVCSNGFGEIVFRATGGGDRCRIATVERVQNKDEAKALVAEREDYEKRKKKDKD